LIFLHCMDGFRDGGNSTFGFEREWNMCGRGSADSRLRREYWCWYASILLLFCAHSTSLPSVCFIIQTACSLCIRQLIHRLAIDGKWEFSCIEIKFPDHIHVLNIDGPTLVRMIHMILLVALLRCNTNQFNLLLLD